jgi:hypothetical protein
MNEERQKIMQMVRDGIISTDEAYKLLRAIDDGGGEIADEQVERGASIDEKASAVPDETIPLEGEALPPENAPDFERFRGLWRTPFTIALAALIIFGILFMALLRSTDGTMTVGARFLLDSVLFAALVMALAWFTKNARWLHVRVRSVNGDRFRISLPFSMRVLRWGLNLGRGYAGEEAHRYLNMVDSMLTAWEQNPDQEPISFDIGGGDRVRVFIG